MAGRSASILLMISNLLIVSLARAGSNCPEPGQPVSLAKVHPEVSCSIEMQNNHCNELFLTESIPDEFRRKCTSNQSESYSLPLFMWDCAVGAGQSTIQQVKDLIELLKENPNLVTLWSEANKKSGEEQEAKFKSCAENEACKKFLIESVGKSAWSKRFLPNGPDEAMEKFRGIQDANHPELRRLMMFNRGYIDTFFQVPSFLTKMNQKLLCLEPRSAQVLTCYYLFKAIDPVLAASYALKLPRWLSSLVKSSTWTDETTLKVIASPGHMVWVVGDKAYNLNNLANFPWLRRLDRLPYDKVEDYQFYLYGLKQNRLPYAIFQLRASPEEVAKIRKFMEEHPEGLATPHHCSSGACEVMRKMGLIDISIPISLSPTLTTMQLAAKTVFGSRRIKSMELVGSRRMLTGGALLSPVKESVDALPVAGAAAAGWGAYSGMSYLITYFDESGKEQTALIPIHGNGKPAP